MNALFTVSSNALFSDCLTDIRQSLAAPKMTKQATNSQLADLLHNIHQSLLDQAKSVLANLQVIVQKLIYHFL